MFQKNLKMNNVSGTFSGDSATVLLSKTELRYPVIVPCSNYEYKIDSRCAGFGTECSEKCLECENVPSACCPRCQLFSTLGWGYVWFQSHLLCMGARKQPKPKTWFHERCILTFDVLLTSPYLYKCNAFHIQKVQDHQNLFCLTFNFIFEMLLS